MIDLKLTPRRLKEHWRYYRWQYIVFPLLALFLANLVFTATKPQTPYNQRVDIVIISDYAQSETSDKWQAELLALLPKDQKEVNFTSTTLMQGQEMTIMQLIAARIAAKEGTIWILPASMYQAIGASEAFVSLEDQIGDFNVPKGTDLKKGMVLVGKDETNPGKLDLCGIPLDQCKGLAELLIPTDMVMCFPHYASENWANAEFAANWLLEKTQLPEGYFDPAATPGGYGGCGELGRTAGSDFKCH